MVITKLNCEYFIPKLYLEIILPIVGTQAEVDRVKHGGITKLCAVRARQLPPRQLTHFHHGRNHVLRAPQGLPVEVIPT